MKTDTLYTGRMWKLEQWRAGQMYNRLLFGSREDAEKARTELTRVEPDMFLNLEPVEMHEYWN